MPPSQSPAAAQPMQREDMLRGLAMLDAEIGANEFLMSIAPIRLISVGGSLAVCLLQNRSATFDIDCLLDPNIAQDPDYTNEFHKAVSAATAEAEWRNDWLNLELEIFVARSRRTDLFLTSVHQDIRIYDGDNLVVYAGSLEWALERKIRRISHAPGRREKKNVDIPDAVALLHRLVCDAGQPLTYAYVTGLNWNGFDAPPTRAALDTVAQAYVKAYGEQGLVDSN